MNGTEQKTPPPLAVALPMQGQSAATITLNAQLPGVGSYQTNVALLYAGQRHPTTINIMRTALAAAPVALLGLGTTRAVTKPVVGGDVPVWLTLQETSNQPTAIQSLTPVSLLLKDAQKTPAAAAFGAPSLHRKGEEAPLALPLKLEASAAEVVEMRLRSLREPGEYTGTIRLATADGETVTKDFTLLVKRGPVWAGLWIALGVIASTFICEYQKTARPRLLQRENTRQIEQDAAGLAQSLPSLEAAEQRVWDAMRGRITTLGLELDRGGVADADARLGLLNHQLALFPKWVKARREVLGLGGSMATPFKKAMHDAELYLSATAEQPADFQTHQTALDQLAGGIEQARLAELDGRLATWVTTAEEQGPALASDASRTLLGTLIARAKAGLTGGLPRDSSSFRNCGRTT